MEYVELRYPKLPQEVAVKLFTVNYRRYNSVKIEDSIKAAAAISNGISSAKSAQKAEITAQNFSGGTRDSVQLSTQLQDIEKNLSNAEVFDGARVAEIKQAISEGRFVVNPEKVADRLLESVRDLLRAGHG